MEEAPVSLAEVYKGVEGLALMKLLRSTYVLPGHVAEATSFFKVNASGKQYRSLLRHIRNKRSQNDAREKYKTLILKSGLQQECRSEMVGVVVQGPEGPELHLIAGATLVEAA